MRQKTVYDHIIDGVSMFDWIGQLLAFSNDLFNGPPADFGIPANCGWASWDIKKLFKSKNIKVWGIMLSPAGDTLMFTVRKPQANRTYEILADNGIPVLYMPRFVSKNR